MIRAVLFDLDDTLVDTWPSHGPAIEAALKPEGISLNDIPPDLLRRIIGRRTRDAFEILRETFQLRVSVDELENRRRPVFERLRTIQQTPYPGAVDALDRLKKEGFRLTLVSSGREHYAQAVLEKWDMQKYFDDVLGGDEVQNGKPDPEPYARAVEVLQLQPEECVVIEDAEVGIESAKAAGCWCIAVKNPVIPAQKYYQADQVVGSLNQLSVGLIRSLG